MNIRPMVGLLFITRDAEETFKDLGGGLRIYFPDDMASAGVTSWAASDRLRTSGFCHIHEPSEEFLRHDLDLTGMRVFFDKWSEREFTLDGHTFYVLDERAILAYEEIER